MEKELKPFEKKDLEDAALVSMTPLLHGRDMRGVPESPFLSPAGNNKHTPMMPYRMGNRAGGGP